jgi:DNA-binding LacI/PurR family transcriptional regulator
VTPQNLSHVPLPKKIHNSGPDFLGPVRQKDIARKAGVSRQTVSLVLRDLPGPSEAAKKKIRRIAEELGYKPDPMLSALAAYRGITNPNTPSYRGGLAYLVDEPTYHKLRSHFPVFDQIAHSATQHARLSSLSFELVPCPPGQKELRRILRVLYHRGVQGLIIDASLPPCPELEEWREFSCIVYGASSPKYGFPCLVYNHYNGMHRLLNEAVALGYRRPLFITHRHETTVNEDSWLASFEHFLAPEEKTPRHLIMILDGDENALAAIQAKIKRVRPDYLIGFGAWLLEHLRAAGTNIPGELGYCDFSRLHNDGTVAGLYQPRDRVAVVLVNLLQSMIHRRERGVDPDPLVIQINPAWSAGATMPARAATPAVSK